MRMPPEIDECGGVYPPREDSLLLLESVEIKPGEMVLDIGTGTGIIAIAAALSGADVYATDISERALECADKNAKKNGVEIEFIRADMTGGIRGKFDVITFNPPYLPASDVEYGDISTALESGEGGSSHIKRLISRYPELLKNGGKAYFVASSVTKSDFLDIGHKVKKIGERSLFFEKLYVFMLTHQKDL